MCSTVPSDSAIRIRLLRARVALWEQFLVCALTVAPLLPGAAWGAPTFPGTNWETRTPAAVGLDIVKLDAVQEYLGGRGCIVRQVYLV